MEKRNLNLAQIVINALICVIVLVALVGCKEVNSAPDTTYLPNFHQDVFVKNENLLVEDDLALYVDYSTCITLGQHSDFFQEMTPSFVAATKHYYSIKGSNIIEEKDPTGKVIDIYRELRNIVEVNYADIASAARMIVNGKSEAVLLTDGEYYQRNIAGGGINNPYMANALKIWLKKGHDIYILAEPYVERYNGRDYNKKRFYFIFTDSRLKNNIYDRICTTVKLNRYPDVELFHLSAHHPMVMFQNNHMTVNDNLGVDVVSGGDYEIQNWTVNWKIIDKFVMNACDPITGTSLPSGDFVAKGLKVDRNSYGGFRISDVELKVYDIRSNYFNYYNAKNGGEPFVMDTLIPLTNAFNYDRAEFDKHGIVNIYFDSIFNPSFLTGIKYYNHTKIDVCVSKCDNIFDQYEDMFNFDAIGQPGQLNTSVTESVKQCLYDSDIKNMMESAILYSIYIQSLTN